jgi:hypothetical protein
MPVFLPLKHNPKNPLPPYLFSSLLLPFHSLSLFESLVHELVRQFLPFTLWEVALLTFRRFWTKAKTIIVRFTNVSPALPSVLLLEESEAILDDDIRIPEEAFRPPNSTAWT